MKAKRLFVLSVVVCLTGIAGLNAQEVLQWRGDDRTGVYKESGLLKQWPETGPALLWENNAIGNGYGSPIITRDRIFINGEIDSVCYLFALDLSGKQIWKSRIGEEWMTNYPGARTTPTLSGGLLYVETGLGMIACIDATTGNEKWSVDLMKDLHGRNNRFGLSESLLVDDHKVFCMTGGADTNMVALDRFTGKIIWRNNGLGQIPAYCSPLLIRLETRNILVTFSQKAMLAFDANDGKLLWSHAQEGEGDVHINTPFYENGMIYYITGDGNGSVKLKLSAEGTSVTQVWRNAKCDNTMGAFVKVGDIIYTSGYGKRCYYSQDANTGNIADSVKFDRGTVNYADGMLYFYNEKGQVGLFKPVGAKMEMVSSFKVTKGTKAHFAHPVICKGVLYIRHGKSLLAYDIKNK
jgi:outer membrane protein assembly factor BamB